MAMTGTVEEIIKNITMIANHENEEQVYTTNITYFKYSRIFHDAVIKLEPLSPMYESDIIAFEQGTDNYVKKYFQIHGSSTSSYHRLLASKESGYNDKGSGSSTSSNVDYSHLHNVTSITTVTDQAAPYLHRRQLGESSSSYEEEEGYVYVTFDQVIYYYYTNSSSNDIQLDINEYMDMANYYNAEAYLAVLRNQSETFDKVKYVTFMEHGEYASYDKLSHNFQVALGLSFTSFFIVCVICGNWLLWEKRTKDVASDNDA